MTSKTVLSTVLIKNDFSSIFLIDHNKKCHRASPLQGFICAAPSSFHEFESPEALPYDNEGTDRGNKYKIEKEVSAYDEDAKLTVNFVISSIFIL